MRILLPGQIREEYRGKHAVIVTRSKQNDISEGARPYEARVYNDIYSPEFLEATGEGLLETMVERVVIGLSEDDARKLAGVVSGLSADTNLRSWIDDQAGKMNINNLSSDAPVSITIEKQGDNYEVVEEVSREDKKDDSWDNE